MRNEIFLAALVLCVLSAPVFAEPEITITNLTSQPNLVAGSTFETNYSVTANESVYLTFFEYNMTSQDGDHPVNAGEVFLEAEIDGVNFSCGEVSAGSFVCDGHLVNLTEDEPKNLTLRLRTLVNFYPGSYEYSVGALQAIQIWEIENKTEGDLVTISAKVASYYPLSSSELRISGPDGYSVNTTFSDLDSDGTYNGTWNSSGASSGTYEISIYVNDTEGNSREVLAAIVEIKSPPTVVWSGGGGGVDLVNAFSLISPVGATIRQGNTSEFEITAVNIGNQDIRSLDVVAESQDLEDWINIRPGEAVLEVGDSKIWNMTIEVPEDAEVGTRTFDIVATGDGHNLTVGFTLTVVRIPEEFVEEEQPETGEETLGNVPFGLSITINGEDETTEESGVTLTMSMVNATECRLNNDGLGWTNWTNWESYNTSMDWELSPAPGLKTVYFQCRNNYGNSTITYDTIELVSRESTLPTGWTVLRNTVDTLPTNLSDLKNPSSLVLFIELLLLLILALLVYRRRAKLRELLSE